MNRSPTTEPVFLIIIREIVGICYSLVVQDGCDPEQLCNAGIGFVAFLKVITLVRDEKNHQIFFFGGDFVLPGSRPLDGLRSKVIVGNG